VGHGLCQRACPTDAIRLVFGTAERGVELPHVQANYETNVPGLFIVGELGGMGLIRNAVEQGLQAADGLAKTLRPSEDGVDVAVVGGGPAGLACALRLHERGLRVVLVEKEREAGGAVWAYPRRKLVMTQPFTLPGQPPTRGPEIAKEDLVALWRTAVAESELPVRTGRTVRAVTPQPDESFTLEMTTTEGETEQMEARRVVLAIGRRGVPRRLGVPGEDGPDVYYALTEPEHFAGRRALVVGGGDAAVEAALALAEQPGTAVTLSYRKDRLSRVKPANLERFTAAEAGGRVRARWNTEVARIKPGRAALNTGEAVPADDVFVFIGGELPTAFLRACGVELETKFGEPR
jgi:thioredoxin reductase